MPATCAMSRIGVNMPDCPDAGFRRIAGKKGGMVSDGNVIEVDARGLLCPLPVLRARKRLLSLPPGATLRLLATDPMAEIDVPHFCAEAGHELVSSVPGTEGRVYLIRRGQDLSAA